MTSVVTVRVTCPKCRTRYADRYVPARTLPELTGLGNAYADDCVVAICPVCHFMVSVVVTMTDSRMRI